MLDRCFQGHPLPRQSPLGLSDSGAALIGPLLAAAFPFVARVLSQPDEGYWNILVQHKTDEQGAGTDCTQTRNLLPEPLSGPARIGTSPRFPCQPERGLLFSSA